MHAKVVNSNPTNYIFLRSAINTLSVEHIKSPFFQNLKIGLECLLVAEMVDNAWLSVIAKKGAVVVYPHTVCCQQWNDTFGMVF